MKHFYVIIVWANPKNKKAAHMTQWSGNSNGDFSYTTPWPEVDASAIVFLLDVRDDFEAEILANWIRDTHPGDSVAPPHSSLALGTGAAGRAMDDADDTWMQPLRIAWLPKTGGDGDPNLLNALFAKILIPGPLRRRWLAKHQPDRMARVVGDGAFLGDLRARGADGARTPPTLGTFIETQALISLERSERTIRGARYKIPRTLPGDVFADAQFQQELSNIAQQRDRAVGDVQNEAGRYLAEMAAAQDPFTLELTIALYRTAARSHHDSEISVNESQLATVAESLTTRPVVFLISHKSMLDTIALSLVLFDRNLPTPLTFGGINLRTPGIGALARRSGVIFLRRSFQDNAIYKSTFRRYIDYLINKRFSLLWALEGTRSRTGKLLPPRFGLFNYVVESILRTRHYDVTFIPVSVAYDQITEVEDYSIEQRGRSKKPEGMTWALRFLKRGKSRGQIHLRFGHGLTINDLVTAAELDAGIEGEAKQRLVASLAFEVAVRMNAATPITSTAIITLILLAGGHRALNLGEIQALARAGGALLRQRKLEIVGRGDFRNADAVKATLADLHETGLVTYLDEGTERLYAIAEEQHHNAAYYRNTAIHHFILDAIIEVALLDSAAAVDEPQSAFFAKTFALRELLKFEFYFPRRADYANEIERYLVERFSDWEDALRRGEPGVTELLKTNGPLFGHAVLRSFIDAYRIVADVLVTRGDEAIDDEPGLISECLKVGKQQLLQGRVFSAEAVSKSLYSTALKLGKHRGLLDADQVDQRRDFQQELRDIGGHLDQVLSLTLAAWDEE
jgi:glycerol-3-phosphate O-acyltransferase